MGKEPFLFIIWQSANFAKERIIEDIQSRFTIRDVYEVKWTQDHYSRNLSRFYGGKMTNPLPKERRVGRGPFTVVIVEDEHPVYENRCANGRWEEEVNIHAFDAKMRYRKWVEGIDKVNDRIHASNSMEETRHDVTLLFGLTPEDFLQRHAREPWDGRVKQWKTDLIGASGWESLRQLFYVLNAILSYAVIRNYETLPQKYPLASEGDVDFLVGDQVEAVWMMNAVPYCKEAYRVLHEVSVENNPVRFDLRYLGDNYYDVKWQETMLRNRVLDPKGFYRLSEEDSFYALLYHAVIQKPEIKSEYRQKLEKTAERLGLPHVDKELLDRYLASRGYQYTKPADRSVWFNKELAVNAYERPMTAALISSYYRLEKLWKQPLRDTASRLLKRYAKKFVI